MKYPTPFVIMVKFCKSAIVLGFWRWGGRGRRFFRRPPVGAGTRGVFSAVPSGEARRFGFSTGGHALAEEDKELRGDAGELDEAADGRFGTEADEAPDEGGVEGAEDEDWGPEGPSVSAGGAGGAAGARPGAEAVPPAKANTLNRVIARFIDILIALLLLRLPGYVGFLAGLTYIGIADGLWDGRSIGKRIIGLRVLRAEGRKPAEFRDSIIRNSTIGVYYALFQIPLLGWALAALGLGFEWLLVVGNPLGMRLGDEIAGTVVADEPRRDT